MTQVSARVTIICATCTKSFETFRSKKAVFCSMVCRSAGGNGHKERNNAPSQGTITQSCAHCKEPFTAYTRLHAQFCSRLCRDQAGSPRDLAKRAMKSIAQIPDSCGHQLTTLTPHDTGYAWLRDGKRTITIQQAIWEITNGPVPNGQIVLQNCGERLCAAIDHLWLGTQADKDQQRKPIESTQRVTITCEMCGDTFSSFVSMHAKYCSTQCYHDAQENVPAEVRFDRKVEKPIGVYRCAKWTGSSTYEYGTFFWNKIGYRAHRLTWIWKNGEFPPGTQANHRCENRWCVREDHIYAGDQKQNLEDSRGIGGRTFAQGYPVPD